MKRFFVGLAAFILTIPGQAISGEVIDNATVGLHVSKPDGWQYLTAEVNASNLRNLHLDDKDFQAAVAKYATAPIIAFTKYAEPYDDVNPSFKINLRPQGGLAGRSASEVLAAVLPGLKRAFADLAIQQEPLATTVSGMPASYARLTYTMTNGGKQYPVTSEMWIVPRGQYFFVIGAGSRQDEANGTRAEIHAIIDKLRIDPQ